MASNATKLISVHSPKAGGTSVAEVLRRAFGEEFATDYSEDPADPRSARNLDPKRYFSKNRRLPESIRCLHGHFHPGQFSLDDVFLFTLLRDPVENMISIYFFWKDLPAQGQPLHDYFLREQLDIFEMARLPLLKRLYSETYFGDFDMSRFDLIGSHDEREDALKRLASFAEVGIDPAIYVNATKQDPAREEFVADTRNVKRLRSILSDDIRFYETHCG